MEQTIVIMCGHDRSGKSTISDALSGKLEIPIFKVQRDKYKWDHVANLAYGTDQICQFLEQTMSSVILDRFHPSDYVYSNLFGRKYDYDKVFDIDERLSKLNALIVICYKDENAYIPDEEDKDFITMADYPRMTELYNKFAVLSKCRILFLNTSDENLEKQLATIIENL